MSDTRTGGGYLEAQAGWTQLRGGYGQIEAGLHPWEHFALYGLAEVDRDGPGAGFGARYTFEIP